MVLPPRDSRVHSMSAMGTFQANFSPGSQATISASPSQPGPQETKIFPPGPGVTRASRGNHLPNLLAAVNAFQTSSLGARNVDFEFSFDATFFFCFFGVFCFCHDLLRSSCSSRRSPRGTMPALRASRARFAGSQSA